MAIRFKKDTPNKCYMKMSHLEETFAEVTLVQGRRHQISDDMPGPAYEGPVRPKLAEAKYKDLIELTKGPNPVIKHPDHIQFYTLLPY